MIQINVLFVCLGNICRSPMAEGIFKKVVDEQGVSAHFNIDSAGTSNYHIDKNPDPRTISICQNQGIVLNHKGKQVFSTDLFEQDYIIAMDASNIENIERLYSAQKHTAKVLLMREFDPLFRGQDVPDPYYGGIDGFSEVFDMLDRSSYELLRYIRTEHSI